MAVVDPGAPERVKMPEPTWDEPMPREIAELLASTRETVKVYGAKLSGLQYDRVHHDAYNLGIVCGALDRLEDALFEALNLTDAYLSSPSADTVIKAGHHG